MLSDKVKNAILEDLNMKEDEEFGIKGVSYKYRINENGLQKKLIGGWNKSRILSGLILGKYDIIKLPFVPEMNEAYYVPDISIVDLYFKTLNYNTKDDKHRIEHELCFRTKQGAINKAKEVLRLLRGGTDE